MQPSSHTLDRLGVEFDDRHLVANAGLLLPVEPTEGFEPPTRCLQSIWA